MIKVFGIALFFSTTLWGAPDHEATQGSGAADVDRPLVGDAVTYDEASRAQIDLLRDLVAQLLELDPGMGRPTGEVAEK